MNKILLLTLVLVMGFIACTDETKQEGLISPFGELEQVDELLAELSEKPQVFSTTSSMETTVTGLEGTIIHVDPSRLEAVDGSPLGDKIDIELIEMTDNQSLIYNNAQTVSNGKILVTGGAYYINMTSNGKQLKMKKGESFAVEFPKLSNEKMDLFLGERDETGQMNWVKTDDKFQAKQISNVSEPVKPIIYVSEIEVVSDSSDIVIPKEINKNEVSKEEYEKYLEELRKYEKRKKEIAYQRKTYQAVNLLNFGWINCDRFYEDSSPKTEIEFVVENDSILTARIFVLFNDIESMLTAYYFKDEETVVSNIPQNKELQIIALAIKNEQSYISEQTITTKEDNLVKIEFEESSQKEIRQVIENIREELN